MHDIDHGTDAAEDYRESATQPPSIYRIVRVLEAYRAAIILSLFAVIIGYVLVAAIIILRAPSQRVVTTPFRLEFAGAGQGHYPNGLKFSGGDIVSAPVATAVYQRNRLERFIPLSAFMSSLVVIESNAALEQLRSEYRAKLADPRIGPIDRDRLTAEFEQKSSSLNKDEWALSLVLPDKNGSIPPTVASKVLQDILLLWAEDTAVTRRALLYRVPTLTANVLAEDPLQDEMVISLTRLRSRINDVTGNIQDIAQIPGSELVRTRRSNMSLAEVDLMLSDLLRTEVEPLIARAIQAGTIRNPAATLATLQAQRQYDERKLAVATRRAEIIRSALNDYTTEKPATLPVTTGTPFPIGSRTPPNGASSTETLMPQLSDTFLDRLMRMANDTADRDYRQRRVDEIQLASLATLPLQSTVAFDQQIIELAQRAPTGGADQATEAALRARYDVARSRALQAVNDVNEIYQLLSRNLAPPAQLYTVAGPTSSRVERSISMFRMAVGGVFAFVAAIPIILAAVLLHHRFIREEEEEHVREVAAARAAE